MRNTFETRDGQSAVYVADDPSAEILAIVPILPNETLEQHWNRVRAITSTPELVETLTILETECRRLQAAAQGAGKRVDERVLKQIRTVLRYINQPSGSRPVKRRRKLISSS